MINYWNQTGVPHKGWTLETVIDVREDDQSEWETDYETCMMCGHDKIRYVHVLSHPEMQEDYRVGCNCAEKMTNDYINPLKHETTLKNKTQRRLTWRKKIWKRSQTGSYYLNLNDNYLLIYTDKRSGKYKVKVEETWGNKIFENVDDAKMEIFHAMEALKELDLWDKPHSMKQGEWTKRKLAVAERLQEVLK